MGDYSGRLVGRMWRGLASEVVEANHVVFHAEGVEKVEDGLCHHWRAAEVVFYVFWGFMLLEVGVAEYVGYEAWVVAYAECVCLLVWEVECEVEVEVCILLRKV